MVIRNWFLFGISGIFLLVLLYFVANRITFLSKSEITNGVYRTITASNSQCSKKSGKRRRSYYDCTKYSGQIDFTAKSGQRASFVVGLGSSRGHNRPISEADARQGDVTEVVYNPNNLTEAFRNTFMDLWGMPFVMFIFQIFTFIGSIVKGKPKY